MDAYAALARAAPPAPHPEGALLQAEALFAGQPVGPEAAAHIAFLARAAALDAATPPLPPQPADPPAVLRHPARHRVAALAHASRTWLQETFDDLAESAATYLELAMPPTEVSERLGRALCRLDTALAVPSAPEGWNAGLRRAMRSAVSTHLERSATTHPAWRATLAQPPRRALRSNPALAVLHYLRATLPDTAGASLWPPSTLEVLNSPSPRARPTRRAATRARHAASALRASLAMATATAMTALGDSPRAWVCRAEALSVLADHQRLPDIAGGVRQAETIAAHLRQWGPREWRHVPKAHAALLAQRLEAVGAPELACLFRTRASGMPPTSSRLR